MGTDNTEGGGRGGNTSGSDDEFVFRTVTATKIIVVQAKVTRSLKRAVVSCETDGNVEAVDDNGETIILEDESETAGDTSTSTSDGADAAARAIGSLRLERSSKGAIAVGSFGLGGMTARGLVLQVATSTSNGSCSTSGDDLILLTRKKGRNSDDLVVTAKEHSDKIDERLSRISEKLQERGDERLAKVQARANSLAEKEAKRLQRVLDRADEKTKRDIERASNHRRELNDRPVNERKARDRSDRDKGGRGQTGGGGQGGDSAISGGRGSSQRGDAGDSGSGSRDNGERDN